MHQGIVLRQAWTEILVTAKPETLDHTRPIEAGGAVVAFLGIGKIQVGPDPFVGYLRLWVLLPTGAGNQKHSDTDR